MASSIVGQTLDIHRRGDGAGGGALRQRLAPLASCMRRWGASRTCRHPVCGGMAPAERAEQVFAGLVAMPPWLMPFFQPLARCSGGEDLRFPHHDNELAQVRTERVHLLVLFQRTWAAAACVGVFIPHRP